VLPQLIVPGAPKCGSTSLHRYLVQHPDVFLPPEKSSAVFGARWQPGVAHIHAQFADARPDQVVGDIGVPYFVDPEAPSRMAAVVPDAQLVFLLREPVARAISHYWYRHRRGYDLSTVAEVLGDHESFVVRNSRYWTQVRRYADHFPREAMHFFTLEDLEADAGRVVGEILETVGLKPSAQISTDRRFNESARPRSRAVARVLDRAATIPMLPPPVRRLGRRLLRLNHLPVRPPDLDHELVAPLRELFAPELEALSTFSGRDLRPWIDGAPLPTR
jgi:hypothetical protein